MDVVDEDPDLCEGEGGEADGRGTAAILILGLRLRLVFDNTR